MDTLNRLAELFGPEFVDYVVALSGEGGHSDPQLTEAQTHVADVLTAHVDNMAKRGDTGTDPIYWVGDLDQFNSAAGTSLLGMLRQRAGGKLPALELVGDEFCDSMLAIARDCFPLLLLKADDPWPIDYALNVTSGIHQHPEYAAAVTAFLADSSLAKLFPFPEPDDQNSERPRPPGWRKESFIVSNHSTGTLQLPILIPQIVASAAKRCLMSGRRVEWTIIRENVIRAVSDLRGFADGRPVSVPALVGLAGISLPPGAVLPLPAGRIRPLVETDRDLFPRDVGVNAVYETTFELMLFEVSSNQFDVNDSGAAKFRKFWERTNAAHRDFHHSIDLMRLGLLLASPPEEPWSVRQTSTLISDGVRSGSQSWDPSGHGADVHELEASSFDEVHRWVQLVSSKHVSPMNIGMRRVLSATTLRSDAIDAFVDAVICWESLFGASTDTVFRVTASIAKLVEQGDLVSREEMVKELKSLYRARSTLVHGGPEPKPIKIEAFRKRAIVIAADCLRRLYGERFDLLDMTSEERGSRILLE